MVGDRRRAEVTAGDRFKKLRAAAQPEGGLVGGQEGAKVGNTRRERDAKHKEIAQPFETDRRKC